MSLEDHAYLEAIDNIKEAGIHHYPELRTMDFHPIPERRLIIHLEGDVEIGMSDGTMHVFHPGDVRLMEDDHGKGAHPSRPERGDGVCHYAKGLTGVRRLAFTTGG